MQRVVGDKAAPDQAPQCVDRFSGIAAAGRLMQRVKEAGAGRFENRKQFFFALGQRLGARALLSEQRKLVREKECDAAVALANRIDAGPGDFACRDQRIETGRFVSGDARRKNRGLEQAMPESVHPAGFRWRRAEHRDAHGNFAAATSSPCQCVRKRASVCCSTGSTSRRSLASDLRRICRRISVSHHSRCRPPGRKPPSSMRPFHRELTQRVFDDRGIEGKPISNLAQREWTVGASVAANKFEHGLRYRVEERCGQARRKRNTQAHRDNGLHLRRQSGDGCFLRGAMRSSSTRRARSRRSSDSSTAGSTTRRASSARDRVAQAQQQIMNSVGGACTM